MENNGKRAVIVWPRRHGKDYVGINRIAVASQQRVGLYWGVYPYLNQGRRIAWNGMDMDGKRFLDAFPKELVKSRQNAEMTLELKNGSVFQIMGSDKPDRFVGANPIGIYFSEWSLMDPMVWKLSAPILNQNNGWAMWLYTPRGQNHGWDMLENAKANPKWYWEHKKATDIKYLSPDQIRNLRNELGNEALFQQEMMCSFNAPIQGAYYETQMRYLRTKNLITHVPYNHSQLVHTAWDLGYDDATSIWFFQFLGGKIALIDYYESSGKGPSDYVKIIGDKDYNYGTHYGPWDLQAGNMHSSGKTLWSIFKDLGLRFKVVKKLRKEEGRNFVRTILPICAFDYAKCSRGIQGLSSHRREWDEMNQTYKNTPVHDWASHPADAFRVLATGVKFDSNFRIRGNMKMETDYNRFSPRRKMTAEEDTMERVYGKFGYKAASPTDFEYS